MGFSSKEDKSQRLLRGLKTLFFLISMLISLLLFSAPILLIIADAFLPSALLSALSPSSLSLHSLPSHFNNYDFRYSLIDIPLVSIIRSFVIFCKFLTSIKNESFSVIFKEPLCLFTLFFALFCVGVYSLCDGPRLSRGPYLGITTICCVMSLIFVSLKAVYIFSLSGGGNERPFEIALFLCSFALAVGHIVVAYRTSCRERRKLLVYKIDIEAVSVSILFV